MSDIDMPVEAVQYKHNPGIHELMEANTYNPGIHELMGLEERPQRFRKFVAVLALGVGGLYLAQHVPQTTTESRDGIMPNAPEFVSPETITPEVASPEIAAVNTALSEIKLGQPNDLDNLVAAIINADAVFAPTDMDRMTNMPAGYVKMLLPHEAIGINVPYTVAERTADKERYTSPEVAAGMLAAAKLYQDLIATKYPHLMGEMLRLRDFNGPSHKTHNTGIQVDFSGSFGWGVAQYANGSLADQQFSERYNPDFTIDMFTEMSNFRVGDSPLISSILYSDTLINAAVNQQAGRNFMQFKKYHLDHGHATFAVGTLPLWRPGIGDMPWSDKADLKLGGEAESITIEQHNSQHQDFELWLFGRQKYIEQLNAQEALTAPEGFTAEPLTKEAEAHIDGLPISEERKDFLRQMVPSVTTVYRAGAKINPIVALTQTSLETGFGNDTLSQEVNNFFGMKAGSKWSGEVFNVLTKEEYIEGSPEEIRDNFRVYPNPASSVADYARLIQNAPHYADAVLQYQSIPGYINGLFSEVDASGNILREQGEPGVLSYGTDRDYEQKLLDAITEYGYEELINAQLNGTPQ